MKDCLFLLHHLCRSGAVMSLHDPHRLYEHGFVSAFYLFRSFMFSITLGYCEGIFLLLSALMSLDRQRNKLEFVYVGKVLL